VTDRVFPWNLDLKYNNKFGRLGFGSLHLNKNSGAFLKKLKKLNRDATTFVDCAPYYAGNRCFKKLENILKRDQSLNLTLAIKIGLLSRKEKGNHVSLPTQYKVYDLTKIKNLINKPCFSRCSFLFQFHQLQYKPKTKFLIKLSESIHNNHFKGVGVANCNLRDFFWCLNKFKEHKIPFKTFQMHANIIEQKHIRQFYSLLVKHKITPVFNRALARGALAYNSIKDDPPINSRIMTSNRVKKWLTKQKKNKLKTFWDFCDRKKINYVEFSLGYLLKRFTKSIILIASPRKKGSENVLEKALKFRITNKKNSFAERLRLKSFPKYYFEK